MIRQLDVQASGTATQDSLARKGVEAGDLGREPVDEDRIRSASQEEGGGAVRIALHQAHAVAVRRRGTV